MWIAANTVGFTLGFLAYPALGPIGLGFLLLAPGLVGGVIIGVVTGIVLVWFARQIPVHPHLGEDSYKG